MKKFLFTIGLIIFAFLFTNIATKAKEGVCILKQQNVTHEIETPFYWYSVTQETSINGMLVPTTNYNHHHTLIKTKESCLNINGASPSFETETRNTAFITKQKNFYFSKNLLSDSNYIFEKSNEKFKIPTTPSTTGYEISSTYISLDDLPPVIALNEINSILVLNVNQKISLAYIKEKITAYDEVDGTIKVEIHEDNYSDNYTLLGTYKITFSATDSSGNTAYLSINIKVVDNIKPTISGQKEINSYMSNPLTINQIKNTLTITDNYDSSLDKLLILKDDYSSNTSKDGTYEVSFSAKDNSGNESSPFIIRIKMIDDIAPTIQGETSYKVNVKSLLDTNTISNQLNPIDNVDTRPQIQIIEDLYTNNYYKVGIYQVSFSCIDKNNNVSAPFIINIIVEDTDKPIFYVSQKFIGVDSTNQIKIEDLIDLVSETNNINQSNITNISILEDYYSSNYNKTGTYTIKIKYEYTDSSESIIESKIIVSDYSKNEAKKNTPKRTFWSVFKNLILKIWNYIKNIFSFFKN